MTETTKKCEDRVDEQLAATLSDVRELVKAYSETEDGDHPELGNLSEYGLGFDFVELGTFDDQDEPYYRWQLSWGGPSSEFRFYLHATGLRRVEFWFLDWFDGACRVVDDDIITGWVWDWFDGAGLCEDHLNLD